MSAVAFYRPNSTKDLFRIFTTWGYGEFELAPVTGTAGPTMELNGAKAVETSETILVSGSSVWEFAARIGVGGSAGPWDFFGGGHGNVTQTSKTITVDGVDKTSVVPEIYIPGDTIIHNQTFNILLPSNPSTVCGTMQVKHTFTSDGMLVEVSLSPLSGYEWYCNYTGMLPLSGFDHIKFGAGAVETIASPSTPVAHDLGSQVSAFLATNTAHAFGIEVSLPSGGPNTTGSWSDAGSDCAWWLDQVGAKLYINDISSQFALRKTAFPRASSTHYKIVKP
jgi:hypothetical protein